MNRLLPSFTPFLDNDKLGWFREQLLAKYAELVRKRSDIKNKIRSLKVKHADMVDQSILMGSIENEIRYSRRCDDLIAQIEKALEKIETGEFGYCEVTGDPIDIRRLEVQPWATLSIKALEGIEKKMTAGGLNDKQPPLIRVQYPMAAFMVSVFDSGADK